MRLVIAMLLVPALALAAEDKSAATSGDPMASWVPPKVKNEAKDKQEIQALFKAMETAGRTGDLDAAAALVDFPVTMLTDDSKGQATGEAWSREQWTQVMKPFYDKPMKDAKITHKPTIFLLTDSLATVTDVYTMAQGGKSITARNAMFVVRRDGKWRVKAMAEGGWGDMMVAADQGAGSATSGSTGSSTSGSTGSSTSGSTGSSTSGSAGSSTSGSTGGVTEPPASSKSESDTQAPKQPEPAERTTK